MDERHIKPGRGFSLSIFLKTGSPDKIDRSIISAIIHYTIGALRFVPTAASNRPLHTGRCVPGIHHRAAFARHLSRQHADRIGERHRLSESQQSGRTVSIRRAEHAAGFLKADAVGSASEGGAMAGRPSRIATKPPRRTTTARLPGERVAQPFFPAVWLLACAMMRVDRS